MHEEYFIGNLKVLITPGGYFLSVDPPSQKVLEFLRVIPFYLDPEDLADEERRNKVIDSIAKELSSTDVEWIKAKLSGCDVIYFLLQDPKITDIWIKANTVVLVRHQEWGDLRVFLNDRSLTLSKDEVLRIIQRLSTASGVSVNVRQPVLDGVRLPSGDRLTASIMEPPYAVIRKFPRHPWTLHKLVARRMLTTKTAALLWLFNEYMIPIMIYGPTGAGKTSLAGAIIATTRPLRTVIIIQDIPEINIAHPHAQYLYRTHNLDYSRLLSLALRSSPHYLLVGEIRSDVEAHTFAQAINVGQGGITTIHAKTSKDVLMRLRRLGLTEDEISNVKVLVGVKVFEKGMSYDRRVTSVDLNDYGEITRVVEYDNDMWIERVEDPRVFDLFTTVSEDVIRNKLRVREVCLDLLARRYAKERLIETAEEWYNFLKIFYSEEQNLIKYVSRPDRLSASILHLLARVRALKVRE